MTEQTYTVKEVASLMRTCDTTIRRWIEAGKVKAYKVSGSKGPWRITKAEIERLTSGVTCEA